MKGITRKSEKLLLRIEGNIMGRLQVGINDLGTTHPEIALEWNYEKNGVLTPRDVTAGSGKKVWWICEEGHEWQASVLNRTRGNNCPFCLGIKVITGENDLATLYPNIAEEWDLTKNGDLKPTDVVAGSGKKVWWKCKVCGYEWQARIVDRSKGYGCNICSRKQNAIKRVEKELELKNSLLVEFPDVAEEWHPTKNGDLQPSDVLPHSQRKVWWKCEKGHEWEAMISNRVKGRGCPVCSKELHTSFPEQAIYYYLKQVLIAENRKQLYGKELDIYLPELAVGIEYNGRYYHARKEDKDKEKRDFFQSKGIRIITITEGFVNHRVEDNIEYNFSSTNKKSLNWAIETLFDMLHLPSGLINVDAESSNIYEQFIVSEKEHSFAQVFPNLVSEWHPTKNGDLKPDQVYCNSGKKVWWKCSKCGYEWQARVADISSGKGCYICGRKKLIENRTQNQLNTRGSLEQNFPHLAKEWHPTKNGDLKSCDVTCGSGKKVWWLCEKGHEWQAIVKSRVSGTGCPVCAGKIAERGVNDLETVHPELIDEWNWELNKLLKPQDVTSHSNKKVWWKCNKCGYEWQAVIANRTKGHGCPKCARKSSVNKKKEL